MGAPTTLEMKAKNRFWRMLCIVKRLRDDDARTVPPRSAAQSGSAAESTSLQRHGRRTRGRSLIREYRC
jgi:hypothetical protein